MPDPRFFLAKGPLVLKDALRIVGASPPADLKTDTLLRSVARPEDADLEEKLVFVEDVARVGNLKGKRFGLCLASATVADAAARLGGGPVAIVAEPRAAFGLVAGALHVARSFASVDGNIAVIATSANVHSSAQIAGGVEIGEDAVIGPNVVIGPGVAIGARTEIAEGASIWCALVGSDVRIGSNAAIGGPGFGFAMGAKGLFRIPQLGRVLVGDNVETGAGVCIDRGALGDTVIGEGTKIDNLVQIAHNVSLGEHCVIAALVGIAGSATIGARVQFGGQAGVADHVVIGDDARIAGKAGVMRDVPSGETWGGYPARPMIVWMRETAAAARAARRKKKAGEHDD